MIGVFDSGCGGLSVLRELVRKFPNYRYAYLGDNARAPYGSRSDEEIYHFTRAGVEFLFARGAELVILACNTASASALRRIQQEVLPHKYPTKRVLGVIIPTAEDIVAKSVSGSVGILATEATVRSGVYAREIQKLNPKAKVYEEACPRLVPMIEMGVADGEGFLRDVRGHVKNLLSRRPKIDTVVLGCTHYAVARDVITSHFPRPITLMAQGELIAKKLGDYLKRHPELERRLARGAGRDFFSTERSARVDRLGSLFYGAPIEFKKVRLGEVVGSR
jgi:glutamate racemase